MAAKSGASHRKETVKALSPGFLRARIVELVYDNNMSVVLYLLLTLAVFAALGFALKLGS